MNRSLLAVIILLLVAVFAYPVKVPCGAPSVACALPPKAGEIRPTIPTVVEPFGVKLLEMLTHSDIQIQYSSSVSTSDAQN